MADTRFEATAKLEDWTTPFFVHSQRYFALIEKHSKYMLQLHDALQMYSLNSMEMFVISERLKTDLRNLAEEFSEATESLQVDMQGLSEIFKLFEKETEKLRNDTPNSSSSAISQ